MSNAIPGPSSRPYLPPAFRVHDYFPPSRSVSRASTPVGRDRRARSASVFSNVKTDKLRSENLSQQRRESAQKLKSAWELLLEKYGSVRPEDDDEVDLATGKVTKYRGGLLDFCDQGKKLPGEDSDETEETDVDELGQWDARSGLDDQGLEEAIEQKKAAVRRWNEEDPLDQLDREEFLRRERELRGTIRKRRPEGGEASDLGSSEHDEDVSWSMEEDDDAPLAFLGRTNSPVAHHEEEGTAEPLLGADSDDELLAQTSDAEEATRVVYIDEIDGPSTSTKSKAGPQQGVVMSDRRSTFGSHSRYATDGTTSRAAQLSLQGIVTPPRHLSPPLNGGIASRRFAGLPSRTPFFFKEPVFGKTLKVKGKEKEQLPEDSPPPSDLDLAAYHTQLARWRDNVTLRLCKLCLAAGGLREERAKWCRGRRSAMFCTFEPPPQNSSDEAEHEDPSYSGRIPERKKFEHRRPRRCRTCLNSGGLRAQRAVFCKGRKNADLCPFDSDASDSDVPLPPPPKPALNPTAELPDVDATKLDPKRYHNDIHYTHGGARIRSCARCKYSGGLRGDRAPWCKGRWRVALCTFTGDDDEEDWQEVKEVKEDTPDVFDRREAEPITLAQALRQDEEESKRRYSETPDYDAFDPSDRVVLSRADIEHETLPNGRPAGLDPTRYAESLAYVSLDATAPRECRHCRAAGGRRAKLAKWCKGRTWAKQCVFFQEGDDGEWKPSSSRLQSVAADQKPMDGVFAKSESVNVAKRAAAKPLGGGPEEGYYIDMRYNPSGEIVKCAKCDLSGGTRREKAPWCKGRRHPRLCAFAAQDQAGDVERQPRQVLSETPADYPQATFARPPKEIDRRPASGPLPRSPSFRGTVDHELIHDIEASAGLGGPGLEDLFADDRLKKESGIGLVADVGQDVVTTSHDVDLGDYRQQITRGGESKQVVITGSSPNLAQLFEDSPEAELRGNGSTHRLDDHRESSAMSASLPPSSPPIPPGGAAYLSVTARPTPSPSLSVQVPGSPLRGIVSSNPPSSPHLPSTLAIRAFNAASRPTPPLSAGSRSSSISSDHMTLSVPRRGILRRPSDSSIRDSTPRSSKRARFSLALGSLPRPIHSDPVPEKEDLVELDDDELLLGPATSPAYPSRPPRRRTKRARSIGASMLEPESGLQFSEEISMRARDLGFDLSQHTGRLSSGMLAALAPVLSQRASAPPTTLASSLRENFMSGTIRGGDGCSLPTPPPSFGSTTANASHVESTPLARIRIKGSTMPPPPVPSKTAAVRLPTPVSGEGEGTDDEFMTPPPHPRQHHRARAKSLDAVSARKRPGMAVYTPSRQDAEVKVYPASTPRRKGKSRLEEELEHVAELVEDESFEWGMDEDVEEDVGRMWRAGSVVRYVD